MTPKKVLSNDHFLKAFFSKRGREIGREREGERGREIERERQR